MLRVVQFETAWESQALLHFAGRPFAVKQSRYPLLPSVGWLPLLLDGQRVVRGEAVVAHVCDVNGDGTFLMPQRAADGQGSASDDGGLGDGRPRAAAEGALSADAAAASTALLSMVRYELDVLWRRWRWTHRRARTEAVVWSQLSPQWMHPARWVALRLIARAEVGRVESNQLECGAATEAAVVRRIVRCYAALTAHLARVRAETGGDFFGGARPGALDAAVFGHLAAVEADAECVRALDARARRKIEEDVAVQRRRRAAAAAKAAKKAAALAAAAEGGDVESAAARGAVRRAAASLLLEKELDAIVAESFGALKAHYRVARVENYSVRGRRHGCRRSSVLRSEWRCSRVVARKACSSSRRNPKLPPPPLPPPITMTTTMLQQQLRRTPRWAAAQLHLRRRTNLLQLSPAKSPSTALRLSREQRGNTMAWAQ